MTYDSKFGPAAQTAAQRACILRQVQDIHPWLGRKATNAVQQVLQQYVAGSLSWLQVMTTLQPTAS